MCVHPLFSLAFPFFSVFFSGCASLGDANAAFMKRRAIRREQGVKLENTHPSMTVRFMSTFRPSSQWPRFSFHFDYRCHRMLVINEINFRRACDSFLVSRDSRGSIRFRSQECELGGNWLKRKRPLSLTLDIPRRL